MEARLGVLLVALGLAACDASGPTPDLGDPYVIQSRPEPVVVGTTLHVTVSYSGGCEAHAFDLDWERTASGTDLWLRHGGVPDPCDAFITEALEIAVPRTIVERGPLRLYVTGADRVEVPVVAD